MISGDINSVFTECLDMLGAVLNVPAAQRWFKYTDVLISITFKFDALFIRILQTHKTNSPRSTGDVCRKSPVPPPAPGPPHRPNLRQSAAPSSRGVSRVLSQAAVAPGTSSCDAAREGARWWWWSGGAACSPYGEAARAHGWTALGLHVNA